MYFFIRFSKMLVIQKSGGPPIMNDLPLDQAFSFYSLPCHILYLEIPSLAAMMLCYSCSPPSSLLLFLLFNSLLSFAYPSTSLWFSALYLKFLAHLCPYCSTS